MASTTKGNFKHFDGTDWITSRNKYYFDTIIIPRIDKVRELLSILEEAGDISEDDFKGIHILRMLNRLCHLPERSQQRKEVSKESMALSETHKRKLRRIGTDSNKRFRCVTDDSKNTQYSTWEKLLDA